MTRVPLRSPLPPPHPLKSPPVATVVHHWLFSCRDHLSSMLLLPVSCLLRFPHDVASAWCIICPRPPSQQSASGFTALGAFFPFLKGPVCSSRFIFLPATHCFKPQSIKKEGSSLLDDVENYLMNREPCLWRSLSSFLLSLPTSRLMNDGHIPPFPPHSSVC